MKGSLALGLSLVALVALACDEESRGPTREPTLRWEEDAPPVADGPEFDDPDFHLTVGAPKPCTRSGPMAPSASHQRISVPVEVSAQGPREVPVSALTFTLEDSEGHAFRPTLAGCAPSLPQKSLVQGERLTGEVAFDIPNNPGPLELRYEPFLIGRKKISARVKVPAAP